VLRAYVSATVPPRVALLVDGRNEHCGLHFAALQWWTSTSAVTESATGTGTPMENVGVRHDHGVPGKETAVTQG
jgi:hypothetical protein